VNTAIWLADPPGATLVILDNLFKKYNISQAQFNKSFKLKKISVQFEDEFSVIHYPY
jgi:hypothetical protein